MPGVSDEEFAAMQGRKKEQQRLAANPEVGMHVYRAERQHEGGDTGIHWTTDPNVAHYTGLAGGDESVVHHAVIDDPGAQIVPRGHLQRLHHRDKSGEITWDDQGGTATPDLFGPKPRDSRDWGLPSEAEVRIRPGARLRTVGISKLGTHGKEPEQPHPQAELPIAHRGSAFYMGLGMHSVQGTEEQSRHEAAEGAVPRPLEPGPLEAVHHADTGKVLGFVSSHRAVGIDQHMKEIEAVHKEHGLEWGDTEVRDFGNYGINNMSHRHLGPQFDRLTGFEGTD